MDFKRNGVKTSNCCLFILTESVPFDPEVYTAVGGVFVFRQKGFWGHHALILSKEKSNFSFTRKPKKKIQKKNVFKNMLSASQLFVSPWRDFGH